jgi:hypothetical protein
LTYLVEIFRPLADKAGETFPTEKFSRVVEELKRKFGGVTVYDRSPAKGKTITSSDDIVVFEVMTDDLERAWGPPAGRRLEAKLRTKSVSGLPASEGCRRPTFLGSNPTSKEIDHEC